MKIYLLVFADSLGAREEIKGYLNLMPEVTSWRYDIPHCFYLLSEKSADELYTKLRKLTGQKEDALFVISEVTSNVQGWLTPGSCFLFQNKALKPEG